MDTLDSCEVTCSICGIGCEYHWGAPTFNGDIVSNDFPDEIWSEGGGGVPACENCYLKHASGQIETFDHYYAHLFGLIDGAGI